MLFQSHIYGIWTSFTFFYFKGNFIVLVNLVNQSGNMHKNLASGFVVYNESITFGIVEELYFSFFHSNKLIQCEST